MVKTPHFQCRGRAGLTPGQGTKIPHAEWHSQKKLKSKRNELLSHKKTRVKLTFILPREERGKTERSPIIPTTQHCGKGKTIVIVRRSVVARGWGERVGEGRVNR